MGPGRRALALTVALRILYSAMAALLPNSHIAAPPLAASNGLVENAMQPSWDWPFLLYGVWERFDSLWYVHIAMHGYDRADATVFFPLYPILIRALTPLAREPFLAALAISTVAAFFLFWGVQELFLLDEKPEPVVRALFFLAVWPASFVLFAVYPDSLLVALIVWSVYFGREGRWWLAGSLGILAGLTKAAGILVCVPLAFLVIRQNAWARIPAVMLAAAGLPAYQLWVHGLGMPSVSAAYASAWHTSIALPWNTLAAAIEQALRGTDLLLEWNLAAILAIASSIAISHVVGIRRWEYIWYSAGALGLFLTKRTDPLLQSSMRYLLAVFPVFLVCAKTVRQPLPACIAALGLLVCNFIIFGVFLGWGLVV